MAVWGQNVRLSADETLKVAYRKYCERLVRKAMSGEDVKASSRCSIQPGGVKNARGNRMIARIKPLCNHYGSLFG
jgi:hypothetical protein